MIASGRAASTSSTPTWGAGDDEARENVFATTQPDRGADQMPPADRVERLVPDFVENRKLGRGNRPSFQRGKAGTETRSRACGLCRGAGERAQPFDLDRDRRRRPWIGDEDRGADGTQALDLRRGKIRPDDDQVGLECNDALEVEAGGSADLNQPRRFRRPVGRCQDTDDAIARTGGKQELRRMRGEADDAPGRRGERDRCAGRIFDRHRRGERLTPHRQEQRRGEVWKRRAQHWVPVTDAGAMRSPTPRLKRVEPVVPGAGERPAAAAGEL